MAPHINGYMKRLFVRGLGLDDQPADMLSLEKACLHFYCYNGNNYNRLVKWIQDEMDSSMTHERFGELMLELDNYLTQWS